MDNKKAGRFIFENEEEQKELARLLQKQSREEMKLMLLQDIAVDLQICNLEGYNPKEYLLELKELIEEILEGLKK